MDPDLFLVIGIIIAVLTIPSLMSAFIEGRTPRAGAVLVLISGTLIVLALSEHPGGYALNDIPQAFYRVVGRYLN
ncbi:MAG: hypothetical protein ACT4OK_10470 [Gemmobacter sp.]